MSRLTVTFRVESTTRTVRGQTAKALLALIDAGPRGATALEASTWAYRFAAYCYELKRRYGLSISTLHESHPGGWHGRHVLATDVQIVSVENREAA
jgi:hypothetical protein